MQITLRWTCRVCHRDQETDTDTYNYGTLAVAPKSLHGTIVTARVEDLRCDRGHFSGHVGLGYRFNR